MADLQRLSQLFVFGVIMQSCAALKPGCLADWPRVHSIWRKKTSLVSFLLFRPYFIVTVSPNVVITWCLSFSRFCLRQVPISALANYLHFWTSLRRKKRIVLSGRKDEEPRNMFSSIIKLLPNFLRKLFCIRSVRFEYSPLGPQLLMLTEPIIFTNWWR